MTVFQASISYNQWNADYGLRLRQASIAQRSDALKVLSSGTEPQARVPAYFELKQLASSYPEEAEIVLGVLMNTVRALASKPRLPSAQDGPSAECSGHGSELRERPPAADTEIQVAMTILGHKDMSKARGSVFKNASCRAQVWSTPFNQLSLSHLPLDNLELSGADLSCSDLSQSSFRRTSFVWANLKGTNFAGASFDDWRNPGFLEHMNSQMRSNEISRSKWLHEIEPSWRRYRCWSASFQNADLTGSRFEGAGLSGADFSGAILVGASFFGANVSRANFRGASGTTQDQFSRACADDPPLFDSNIIVPRCQ